MRHEASDAPRFKVAEVDELPPGKGKVTTIAGREITVFNEEGRYVATASAPLRAGDRGLEINCQMNGHHFDTGHPATSPDRLHIDDLRYQVVVDDGSVYIVVEKKTGP